jgi:glutamate dehydrogenase/leucine dehydrogenase
MRTTKLEKTNGFLVIDLDDAPLAVGVTRLAPKVLQDGAELLARSITYSFASYGLKLSGGSAGINAPPDARDEALAAYVEEVTPLVTAGTWRTWAGTGLTDDELAAVSGDDAVSLVDHDLTGRAAVAAARAALGSLATVAIAAAVAAGATVVEGGLDAEADALLVGGKSGVLDHDAAATVQAKCVVALSPVPVTAKAYAVLSRAGVVYVPDFLVLAAPLLAALDAGGGDPVERVSDAVAKVAPQGIDAWRAAVADAEAFLATWQPALPYGRPLA